MIDQNYRPTPRAIFQYLDRRIVGQDQAKKIVSTALYYHREAVRPGRGEWPEGRQVVSPAGPILALGPTGVGKTLLIQAAARFLALPLVVADCPTLVTEGVVGRSLSGLGISLLQSYGNDPAALEGTIFFGDEFDKLFVTPGPFSGAISSQLLRLIEGGDLPLETTGKDPFVPSVRQLRTSSWLFILAGAFQAAHEDRVLSGRALGFGAAVEERDGERPPAVSPEDLIQRGVPRELAGRLRHVVNLNHLRKEDLLKILRSDECSPINEINRMVKSTGHRIEFADGVLEEIADEAIEAGTGARGLRQSLLSRAQDSLFDVPSHTVGGVVRIDR